MSRTAVLGEGVIDMKAEEEKERTIERSYLRLTFSFVSFEIRRAVSIRVFFVVGCDVVRLVFLICMRTHYETEPIINPF